MNPERVFVARFGRSSLARVAGELLGCPLGEGDPASSGIEIGAASQVSLDRGEEPPSVRLGGEGLWGGDHPPAAVPVSGLPTPGLQPSDPPRRLQAVGRCRPRFRRHRAAVVPDLSPDAERGSRALAAFVAEVGDGSTLPPPASKMMTLDDLLRAHIDSCREDSDDNAKAWEASTRYRYDGIRRN